GEEVSHPLTVIPDSFSRMIFYCSK
ncbi:MAG: hypothetical protein ACI8RZ_006516, partial [Myxococcota bacterium]